MFWIFIFTEACLFTARMKNTIERQEIAAFFYLIVRLSCGIAVFYQKICHKKFFNSACVPYGLSQRDIMKPGERWVLCLQYIAYIIFDKIFSLEVLQPLLSSGGEYFFRFCLSDFFSSSWNTAGNLRWMKFRKSGRTLKSCWELWKGKVISHIQVCWIWVERITEIWTADQSFLLDREFGRIFLWNKIIIKLENLLPFWA